MTLLFQEDRAFSLYKRALELGQRGNYPDAEELLISILNDDFLANVSFLKRNLVRTLTFKQS